MSGRGKFRWTDEQRHALERRVIDEHMSMAQAHREANAGELRVELAGPKLHPFKIPLTSVHAIVKAERTRRRDLHLEAAAIEDPEMAHREMSRILLAEMRFELMRMSNAMKTRSKRTNTAWDELTQASRALEAARKAIGIKDGSNGMRPSEKPESNGGEEAKPSLVADLAKTNGSETVPRPHAAAEKQGGDSQRLGPGQTAAQHGDGAANAVPSHAPVHA